MLTKEFYHESFILGIDDSMGVIQARLCYGSHIYERIDTTCMESFTECMKMLADKYYDDIIVYIPVEEQTTDYFVEYIARYGCGNFTFLLPDKEIYRTFRNKEQLNDLCLKYNFPAPIKFNVAQLNQADYPILLKPVIGSGSRGLMRLYSVNDLTNDVKRRITEENYLAQELLPNGKAVKGAFFLCKEGEVLGAYTHSRIRTVPEEGGVTVLSKMDDQDRLISQGAALLKQFRWTGLIMLEYLYDARTDEWKLIEANPRLWGSIMLAEFGGAYLLTNYVRYCIGQNMKETHIDADKYIRWLFPMDIMCLIKRRFQIRHFWNFRNQCFINWTYARKDRAIAYLLFSMLNMKNIKKFFSR